MGILDSFTSEIQGYFRCNDEESFPWTSIDRSVWYALITVECGKIVKYGFTSSKSQKQNLYHALIKIDKFEDCLLLGVFNGKYKTDLFVLNIEIAQNKLKDKAT